MKFFKTIVLDGLFVLLPLLLLWLGLSEIGEALVGLATPIADLFPSAFFEDVSAPLVVAVVLLVGTACILGLLARLPGAATAGRSFENAVLYRVPLYRMLKIISSALLDTDESEMSAALLQADDGSSEPCYVIKEHGDELATVLLPWSPASFAGSIRVVPKARLEYLSCSIDELSRSVSLMGVGLEECITAGRSKAPAE